MHNTMTIKDAAHHSGVSAKMIRYYESIQLIPAPQRSSAGYRYYAEHDIHRLRFVRRARDLGFSVGQTSELLALWENRDRASADVKALALGHVRELEAKIHDLQTMVHTLQHLAEHCHGDARPHCPILADLAGAPPAKTPDP